IGGDQAIVSHFGGGICMQFNIAATALYRIRLNRSRVSNIFTKNNDIARCLTGHGDIATIYHIATRTQGKATVVVVSDTARLLSISPINRLTEYISGSIGT